jgi:type II secretory pathway component GspD/PulD (secretin)
MKTPAFCLIPLLALAALPVRAQQPEDGSLDDAGLPLEPVAPPVSTPVPDADPDPGAPGAPLPDAPVGSELVAPVPDEDPAVLVQPFGPLEEQKREMEEESDGYTLLRDAALNDIFQYLARTAGRQYFHNSKITGPEFTVTGHLNDGNPLMQMEELAFQYGLTLHVKGETIYALTQAQLAQLPSAEFHYQLRYLRPTDMDGLKELIRPLLSPGTGLVNFEPKTNTIVIIDTAHRIEQARNLLRNIDRAKGQIIVETKILRVNSNAAQTIGGNWSASLGERGITLNVIRDLASVFGLPSELGSETASGNLVLSPVQVSGVLRAMAQGGLANQVSNPTLITEDNEQATISIIDRVPIITTTITQGQAVGVQNLTEEVRYRIDDGDPTIDKDAENHREIGISLVVTPTLLPDGTIRMQMRPRSAQIVGEVRGQSGNVYPRVSESMIETLARVPDGHSLVVGGFYGEGQKRANTKVPLLGDVPVLNFFFKSKEADKEQSSLVFIVTPTSYNPASGLETITQSARLHGSVTLPCDHDWVDENNPGPAHEPNLPRAVRGLQPHQAPYYPTHEELHRPPPPPVKPKVRSTPRIGGAHRR